MKWSQHVNDLKSRVGDLERQLHEAQKRVHDAMIAESGVAVGDIVLDKKGERYLVAEVEPQSWGGAWVIACPQKKDGTFGTARRRLFDFTKSAAQ